MKLLTVDNKKILKSREFGYFTFGLHLAPHTLSGYNTCKFSTKSCRQDCLNFAGMGSLSKIQESRIKKTKLFFENRNYFMNLLLGEINYYIHYAKSNNLIPVCRLNLTSDIDWQQEFIHDKTVFEHFPDLQFMDYTKEYNRVSFYNNYDITYSYDSINHNKAMEVHKKGYRIAVVFSNVPDKFYEIPVENGDVHDLRFLNSKNKIVGLKYKNVTTKGFNNGVNKVKSTLVVN